MVLLHSYHNRNSHDQGKHYGYSLCMQIAGVDKKRKEQTGHISDHKHDGKHKKAEIRFFRNATA